MSKLSLFYTESFDVPCRIEIENTFESLHAHVELDGNPPINPGDKVGCMGRKFRCPTAKA